MSRVSNQINRNIDQDRSGTDADIEILNITSPDYNTQDTDQHEVSLNEAWRFINAARQQNFTQNEDLQRNYRLYDQHNMYDQNVIENIEQNCIYRPTIKNNSWDSQARTRKQDINYCLSTINDFLDEWDDSSDEDAPNVIDQNCANFDNASQERVEVYDGPIYAVANEGPMLIYSYKNKYYTSDPNEVLINSPNQDSQSNSTSSISVENLNEESVNYEKSFYRIATSFHPIIIPRLPLTSYKLPTVTEILEPYKQSAKVTEVITDSDEDNLSIKRKPTNGWVMKDDDSSHSDADNTAETNIEDSANESPDNKEQSLHSLNNTYSNQQQENDSSIDIKENNKNCVNKVLVELHNLDPTSRSDSKSVEDNEKEIIKHRNNYFVVSDVIQVDSAPKDTDNDSIKSKNRSSSIEFLSKHSSVPTLNLSLNSEGETNKQSWFKRFTKCILCCK